jgi:hypothetical protein
MEILLLILLSHWLSNIHKEREAKETAKRIRQASFKMKPHSKMIDS